MSVTFRNLTVNWSDPIDLWPYEAVITTMERGMVSDWQPIIQEVQAHPWGRIARYIEDYAKGPDDAAVAAFFTLVIERTRQRREAEERIEVQQRVRAAVDRSGVTAAEFARNIGTSASRFSTYLRGKVVPSAAMLVRMERTANR